MDYKIIGGDGREYGPVTLDELKSWIREGRISRDSLIARSDVGVWLSAEKFSELQLELGDVYAKNPSMQRSTFESVGFWPRVGAFLLDNVAMWVVFFVVWEALGVGNGVTPPIPNFDPNSPKLIEELIAYSETVLPYMAKQWAVYFPMHFLYHVLLNGLIGATLGKMIIGAKIVNLDGSNIGIGRAILRYFGARLSDFICYIGYLFVAFRDDKRGLHDLIAKTRVIYKR